MDLDPYLLVGADWCLEGPQGVLASWMRLLPDGTVLGPNGRAGRFWEVAGGRLTLLGEDRAVLLAFDGIALAGEGRLRLSGAETAPPRAGHAMVQLPRSELALEPAKSAAAVLIRTHVVNSKLFSLWSSLAQARNFDVYVNIDETRGRSWIEGPRILRHTVDECMALGLWRERRDDYLWFFGDYPIYTAMRQLRDYDTFVQVEYDVHFAAESPVFLEALIDRLAAVRSPRIAAAGIYHGDAVPGWPWAEEARRMFGTSQACFFPFVVVTRGAAEFLLQLRRNEAAAGLAPVHCEAFVPTALQAGGLTMVDVNRLVANAVRPATFGLAPMPLGLSGEPDGGGATQMHHPVSDQSEFMARCARHAWAERNPEHLLRWARHPRIRPDMRERLEAEARRMATEIG